MKSNVPLRILAVYFSFLISVGFGKPPNKIQNGESARIGDFPSHVSIYVDNEHHCGGSIISRKHILTAAHCTLNAENKKVKNIKVLSGIDNQEDRVNGIFHDVIKIINHRKYNISVSFQHDISILKLKTEIILNATRRSIISLPTKSIPFDSVATAIGFGQRSWSKFCPTSTYLQAIQVHVLTNRDCQGDYDDMKIHPDWVCVYHGLLSGICPGDSGGPLILGNEVVGIAVGNFHKYHGHSVPDIYTRVYDYLPWISDIMLQY